MKRSRITGRFKPSRCELFASPAKSPPHVKGNATRRARHWGKVLAVKAALDRELGR